MQMWSFQAQPENQAESPESYRPRVEHLPQPGNLTVMGFQEREPVAGAIRDLFALRKGLIF